AKLLNDWFVCIKVDREERPDIDNVYMTALHVLRESGGWPLSMFLTADAKPIVGGTYWPPEDKSVDGQKTLGLKGVLRKMHELPGSTARASEEQADEVAERTSVALAGAARGVALMEHKRGLAEGAMEAAKDEYEKPHGGFGPREGRSRGPKFPPPPILGL